MKFRCPNCEQNIDILDEDETISEDLTCPSCKSRIQISAPEDSTYILDSQLEIGRFQVREKLGEGAFGSVFRAWDNELQRDVAIKVPRPDRISSGTTRQFLKEARSASKLRHSGIVHVHEIGKHDEQLYIVCDYVDGVSLRDWMHSNSPDLTTITSMVAEICDAIDAAHSAGVTHRDLKPSNILIDKENRLYVADFGLAKNDALADATVTREGELVGTPAYMSPEQAEGRVSEVGRRSDVYSTGVILYELLTKQRPFTGSNTRTLLHRIQTEDPTAPRKVNPQIPKDLETICLKALSKSIEARYLTAADFAADLRRFSAGEHILARPTTSLEKFAYRCRKSPYAVACVFLLVAIGALGFGLWNQPTAAVTVGETNAPKTTKTVLLKARRDDDKGFTKCKWAIVPLDEKTRLPDPSRGQQFTDRSELTLQLEPAEYLVVIDIPGFGFHEVYRELPAEMASRSEVSFKHLRVAWDESTEMATWPEVVVMSEDQATDRLVLIPGGDVEMGEGTKFSPKHMRSIDDFWVGRTEVTNQEYISSNFSVQTLDADTATYAASEVTWHSATAYAESVGQRLPTEQEYEYLATNLSRSEFPSGDAADYDFDTWSYGPVSPTRDRLEPFGVEGLFSNVAEWTDSIPFPYPGVEKIKGALNMMNLSDYRSDRVIRGGPVIIGHNDRTLNDASVPEVEYLTPRTRTAFRTMTMDSEVGFRCVRSSEARFIE